MKAIRVIITLFVSLVFASNGINAQKNSILFTIADRETITTEEFKQMYERNNVNVKDNTSIDDYLNLYINYRLKLLQAHDIGLDKDSSTIKQVEDYRRTLIKPYVNDPKVMDSLVLQAYNRLNTFIRVSQILIRVPDNIAFQDTLQYYQKAQMVYQKALKGEDFTILVDTYSDDPAANPTNAEGNHGDLGYFTSMAMIYPFENACYSLIENNTSDKKTLKDSIAFCKSQFGYHIIKLISAIPAPFSTITLAHIFINGQKHSEQESDDLINQAYNLISPLGFDSVAKQFSDDAFSARNGGLLQEQRPNTIPSEYIDMYLNSAVGKTTKPFKTRFGWHIVQFVSSTEVPELDDIVKDQIYKRISKDERALVALDMFVDKSKKFYGFKIDSNALNKLSDFLTDSVFSATWQIPDSDKEYEKLEKRFLCSIGNKAYSVGNFGEFIFENQTSSSPVSISKYINQQFEGFFKNNVVEYATEHITELYPKLKESLQEFENGVLIFDLTDKIVWSKSLSDTTALQDYYEENKSKYLYTPRADATIWIATTDLNVNKIKKQILKYKKKSKSDDEIKDILLSKIKVKKDTVGTQKTKTTNVSYSWGRFEKGMNNLIDKNIFDNAELNTDSLLNTKQKNLIAVVDNKTITNRNVMIILNEMMPVSIKPLFACKGLVTSDYQEVLEARWIEDLRKKYPVKINYEQLNSIR